MSENRAFKLLRHGMKSPQQDYTWELLKHEHVTGEKPVKICDHGFHGYLKLKDIIKHVDGFQCNHVYVVEHDGIIDQQGHDGKFVSAGMRLLKDVSLHIKLLVKQVQERVLEYLIQHEEKIRARFLHEKDDYDQRVKDEHAARQAYREARQAGCSWDETEDMRADWSMSRYRLRDAPVVQVDIAKERLKKYKDTIKSLVHVEKPWAIKEDTVLPRGVLHFWRCLKVVNDVLQDRDIPLPSRMHHEIGALEFKLLEQGDKITPPVAHEFPFGSIEHVTLIKKGVKRYTSRRVSPERLQAQRGDIMIFKDVDGEEFGHAIINSVIAWNTNVFVEPVSSDYIMYSITWGEFVEREGFAYYKDCKEYFLEHYGNDQPMLLFGWHFPALSRDGA